MPISFSYFFHPSDNKARRLNKVKPTKASSWSYASFRWVITLEFFPNVLEDALSGVLNLKTHRNGP